MRDKVTKFIFSACRGDSLDQLRIASTNAVLQMEPNCTGVYEGTSEPSYLVTGAEMRKIVEDLCEQNDQDCYLEISPENLCWLVYPDGEETFLGPLQELPCRPGPGVDYTEHAGRYWRAGGE